MKAVTTLGDGITALKMSERPTPQAGRDEVLVKMAAAALNFRDLLVVNGTGAWRPHAPRVPVSDGVGVVVAAGEAVTRFRPGDRVIGIFSPRWLDGDFRRTAGHNSSAENPYKDTSPGRPPHSPGRVARGALTHGDMLERAMNVAARSR
jgi:NADPH:quinone reductase-like Zn-dependent oxidoreductase